ncbi:RNA polymerase ECF-type sigma factor [Planctomycetales bacterium 10988]|nr:RNA polymerase ECF-type sigma factor [Planctomycetales bacterium 10988]
MNQKPREQPEDSAETIDWTARLAEHEPWLRTIIGARLGEPQAIDEVLQEVSLAVVKSKSLPTDPEKVAPWLYRVAVAQTMLYRRKAGRRRKLINRYAEQVPDRPSVTPSRSPLQRMLAEERQEQVRKAVAQLSRRDSEILLLKYMENWSYREIAQKLGVSESAVEARLHRARKRLRDQIASLDQPPPSEPTQS